MEAPPRFKNLKISNNGTEATLVLDRPERLNALSTQMMNELIVASEWFDKQPDLRVVTISGSGKSFCAGFDVDAFIDEEKTSSENGKSSAEIGRLMSDSFERMGPISIACLHGNVVGGGVVLAAACDLRVASKDTVFSIPEVDLGIPLAWGGIPRLVREIGPTLTKELVMTCRPFNAEEAANIGFLNKVVNFEDLNETVKNLSSTIVSKPRIATLATKAHVNAVTSQMVGITRSWADSDSLDVALRNPESQAAQKTYLNNLKNKKLKKK